MKREAGGSAESRGNDRRIGGFARVFGRRTPGLAEMAASLEVTAAAMPEPVVVKDRRGRVRMANKAALEALKLTRRQAIGRGEADLRGAGEATRYLIEADNKVLTTGESTVVEERRISPDGERVYVVTRSPLRSAEGTVLGLVETAFDITERSRWQSELESALNLERSQRSEAERANRAKDQLLADVSHELRAPLNALRGWSDILANSREVVSHIQLRAAEAIRRNVEHQARIVDDLLDLAAILVGRLQLDLRSVNLVDVVWAAIELLRASAQHKGVELGFCSAGRVVLVPGDHRRLQQVVVNLISNAIKFTPEAGQVIVRLRQEHQSVILTVTDTGIGIEPEFLPCAFERFSQADPGALNRGRGLGIGLSMVRELVELHGGVVTADSEGAGRGATFTVILPAMENAAALDTADAGTGGAGR